MKEAKELAKALCVILAEKNEKERKIILDRLVNVLKEQNKSYLLKPIYESFLSFWLRGKKVEISVARSFEDKGILRELEDFSRKVLSEEKEYFKFLVDKNLVGGFILKDENYLVRASIKDFLFQIKEKNKL